MNIWLIQIGEPLPIEDNLHKMRFATLAGKLVERGHKVLWWASAFDHFKKEWLFRKDTTFAVKDGLIIKALRGISYKKNISLTRLIDSKIIAWKFKKTAPKMQKPDVIIASTPTYELAYEATVFARKNKIPVLVDITDPWPDLFLDHVPLRLKKVVKVLLYKDFQMIKKTMEMADSLIAVTNTFLEWGLNYAEREKTWRDRILYIGYKRIKVIDNTKSMERFKDLIEILRKKFTVFFVGTISKSYHDPSILLEVAEKLIKYNDIHFVIAGAGEHFDDLKKKAQGVNNTTLTGWLDQNEIAFLLQYSKIGVCPSTKAVTLPTNKFYAYLSAGLPVISAFEGDIKSNIESFGIGFYYPPNNVDVLVGFIKRLYEDKVLYEKMSQNARRVFNDMFDANKIYGEYVAHIEKIIKEFNHL